MELAEFRPNEGPFNPFPCDMTVRWLLPILLAALLAATGCSDGGGAALGAEHDDPLYVEAQQLKKQDRYPEALNAYLKVIDRRGGQNAPESHLEAGAIYLHRIKDPVAAYYHFRKYLQLEPNSKQAPFVRGMVDAAAREFARTLKANPMEDQSVRMAMNEETEKLRKENEELRAELATLRGGGAVPMYRASRATVSVPAIRPEDVPPTVIDSPISSAPVAPAPIESPVVQPAPVPPRKEVTPRAPATRPAAGGRSYTVKPGEGLFAIARQFDAKNTSRKMREIVDANPEVLPEGPNTRLRPGMVLRIP